MGLAFDELLDDLVCAAPAGEHHGYAAAIRRQPLLSGRKAVEDHADPVIQATAGPPGKDELQQEDAGIPFALSQVAGEAGMVYDIAAVYDEV